jgi:hypothetical protein
MKSVLIASLFVVTLTLLGCASEQTELDESTTDGTTPSTDSVEVETEPAATEPPADPAKVTEEAVAFYEQLG